MKDLLVFLPCLLLTPLMALPAAESKSARPNVVILQTDEHNFRTLGCYRALLPQEQAFIWGQGVAVETPHIDSLARRGALCDRFYAASPVCTPSRASFLTGRHPQNTGADSNDRPMRDDVVTFAEVLRRAGYKTGYAGKWHVDGPARPGWTPARQFGFEDNRYMFNRGHWKELEDTPSGPAVKARNAKGSPTYNVEGADEKTFTTDFLADKAVAFIQAHRGEPFCFMVSFPDPHGPNTVRPPYDTMYTNLIYPDADPCLFDLEQDPFEMKNLFASATSRATVRELARALGDYAQLRQEPYAKQPALRADLDWAAHGAGAYTPPKREPAAMGKRRPAANEDEE